MNKNSQQELFSKENLEKIANSFLSKSQTNENNSKIKDIINSLSEEDINKISNMIKSGQLQKIANAFIEKNSQKR